jgi:hypothetical protein
MSLTRHITSIIKLVARKMKIGVIIVFIVGEGDKNIASRKSFIE